MGEVNRELMGRREIPHLAPRHFEHAAIRAGGWLDCIVARVGDLPEFKPQVRRRAGLRRRKLAKPMLQCREDALFAGDLQFQAVKQVSAGVHGAWVSPAAPAGGHVAGRV